MRAWTLCGAALSASIVASLSLVLLVITFMALYTGQLPVENNQRSLMQSIQVMLYLLPFLMLCSWCCYMVIFSLFQAPTRVWQMGQIMKVQLGLFLAWCGLLMIVIPVDFSLHNVWETATWSMLSYAFFILPIVAGLGCGNIFYLKQQSRQPHGRKTLWKNLPKHMDV